jgi:hypothetical protein
MTMPVEHLDFAVQRIPCIEAASVAICPYLPAADNLPFLQLLQIARQGCRLRYRDGFYSRMIERIRIRSSVSVARRGAFVSDQARPLAAALITLINR